MANMSRHRIRNLPPEVRELMNNQSGVLSAAQIVALGHPRHVIEIWRRNRLLTIELPGVYAGHDATPDWNRRAWAAVLYAAAGTDLRSAALCGWSATRAHEGPGRGDNRHLDVAIARQRRVKPQPGVHIQRVGWLDDEHVIWARSPARQRYEYALLDIAIERLGRPTGLRHLDAIGILTEAVGKRRTTAARLSAALAERPRATERRWLKAALDDIGSGARSVLESGYLRHVVRPHGLPLGELQARAATSNGVVYRDVDLGAQIIELDGEIGHTATVDRDSDHERDLDAALAGKATIRLSWGQIFDRPCLTAGKVARLLTTTGLPTTPSRCQPGCPAPEAFASRVV